MFPPSIAIRLENELNNNCYTYLDELLQSYSIVDFDYIIAKRSFEEMINCIDHMMTKVALSYFVLSDDDIQEEHFNMNYHMFEFWTLVYIRSFRVNQDLTHPVLKSLSSILHFGHDKGTEQNQYIQFISIIVSSENIPSY
jgi:hypothetical protein